MVICRTCAHMLSYRPWGEVGQWPRRLMQRSVWGYYIATATEAGVIPRSKLHPGSVNGQMQELDSPAFDQHRTLCYFINGGKMCLNFSSDDWETSAIVPAVILNGGITGHTARFRFYICCHSTLLPIGGALAPVNIVTLILDFFQKHSIEPFYMSKTIYCNF